MSLVFGKDNGKKACCRYRASGHNQPDRGVLHIRLERMPLEWDTWRIKSFSSFSTSLELALLLSNIYHMLFKNETKKSHLGTCNVAVIECNRGCGAKYFRRNNIDHASECPEMTTTCEFCHSLLKKNDEIDHLYKCPDFKIPCQNNCGATEVKRSEVTRMKWNHCQEFSNAFNVCPLFFWFKMINHLESNCPRHHIKCPFSGDDFVGRLRVSCCIFWILIDCDHSRVWLQIHFIENRNGTPHKRVVGPTSELGQYDHGSANETVTSSCGHYQWTKRKAGTHYWKGRVVWKILRFNIYLENNWIRCM